MIDNLVIRKMEVEDAEGIVDVAEKTWRTAFTGILSEATLKEKEEKRDERIANWRTAPTTEGEIVFVAELDGKIVGFIEGGLQAEDKKYRTSAEIGNLYVLKEYQKFGVGKLLFNTMLEELKLRGCKNVILYVIEKNNAKDFYKKMGGILVETRKYSWGENLLTDEIYSFSI